MDLILEKDLLYFDLNLTIVTSFLLSVLAGCTLVNHHNLYQVSFGTERVSDVKCCTHTALFT